MAVYSKQLLSGSVNGKGIKITGTTPSGTTIHTSITGTTSFDEIWLYATNTYASPVILTIEWGSPTAPDDNIIQTLQLQNGLVLIISGLLLNNALIVKAYASVANVVVIHGYVNRIV